MKKIFTLFSALLLTVSMWGQVARTYTMHTISNVSVEKNQEISGYTVSFKAKGNSSADSKDYTETVTLYLANTTDWLGTFTTDAATNGLKSTSKVVYSTTTRYPVTSASYVSTITIANISGSTYQISGFIDAAQQTSSTTPFRYDFGDGQSFSYDPYKAESSTTKSFTYTAEGLSLFSTLNKTPITLQLGDENGAALFLQFNVEDYAIPAGTYNVASTGANGTLMASKGTIDYATYYDYEDVFSGTSATYYITSGSVTVSYNEDKSKITLSGSLTSAKGSTIALAEVTLDNPIKELPPINVNVTSIEALTGNSWSAGDYFVLNCTSNPECALTLYVNDILGKDFTVNDIDSYSYVGDKYVVVAKSSATITNTSGNNFLLNATLFDQTGQKYIITDAAFTCQLPTPWDDEPAKETEGITLNISSIGKDFAAGVLTLYSGNDDYYVELAISAAEDKLVAGTYTINDTKNNGTIIASPGKDGSYPAPSYLTMYEGWDSYDYFLRSGSLTVGFSADNKKMTITGDAYTFRETKVTFNVEVDNPYYKGEATLNVTSITPNMGATDYITFGIEASGTGILSGAALTVNTTELVGDFDTDDLNLELSWVGQGQTSTYLDATKANSVKVTQNGFEYTLDATVFGANGSTYKMTGSFVIAELNEEEDNSALLTAAMGQTVDLDINRPFASGMWQTICLPFDIANVAESPLAGAIVKTVTNCVLDGETLLVYAEDVTAMTAGMPYLIMWEGSDPLDEIPTFSGVTIAASEGVVSGNFVANMSAKHYDDVAGKYIVVQNNGLAPMGSTGTMKGFRAYFQINAPAGVVPRKFAFAKNGATGNETPAAAMKASKVLKNGQLMLLNGEKVYNAQAQELK